MEIYICIALDQSAVIEVVPVEAADDFDALKLAMRLCDQHSSCTCVEVWHHGRKVHNYLPTVSEHLLFPQKSIMGCAEN